MKKQIFAAALVLMMLLSLAVPAFAEEPQLGYVTDQAGLLDMGQWTDLTERAEGIAKSYSCGVYLIILDDYSDFGESPEAAAKYLHKNYSLGYGEGKDTILLLLSMTDRKYWLLGYGDVANTAMTDHGRAKMSDKFVSYFRDDEWYDGFVSFYDTSENYLRLAMEGEPFDVNTDPDEKNNPLVSYGAALVIGLVTAFIVCTIFRNQMNTAVKQVYASEYVEQGGVDIRNRSDRYTHTTTSRRKIEKESSSGGGTSTDSDGYSGSGGSF